MAKRTDLKKILIIVAVLAGLLMTARQEAAAQARIPEYVQAEKFTLKKIPKKLNKTKEQGNLLFFIVL